MSANNGDWWVFVSAMRHFLHPYGAGFVSPPWVLLFLPHALIPGELGAAINRTCTLMIAFLVWRKAGGRVLKFAWVLLFPPLWLLLLDNNIDWVVWLGYLLPSSLGLIAMSTKPQVGLGLMLMRYWRRANPLPLLCVIAISFIVYGNWLVYLQPARPTLSIGDWVTFPATFTFFPYGIPVGMWLMWQAVKRNNDFLAALAMVFVAPYYAVHSLVLPLLLIPRLLRRADKSHLLQVRPV